ncbi:hypothetical protein EDB67_10984 [Vibrio crassostreae]|uniref:hypothetical protein n=1 Tax=Vibrio crassostreae TaxID=246167 RepID=UPI000F480317|nr:hypothetical protein [Vibrio crassostreae]ROR22256.1 hypothetical protein EDB67_10984 [Vibrio crassostreae]
MKKPNTNQLLIVIAVLLAIIAAPTVLGIGESALSSLDNFRKKRKDAYCGNAHPAYVVPTMAPEEYEAFITKKAASFNDLDLEYKRLDVRFKNKSARYIANYMYYHKLRPQRHHAGQYVKGYDSCGLQVGHFPLTITGIKIPWYYF